MVPSNPVPSTPTRLLRSTLEESLEAHVASTVLFEALGAAGPDVPHSLEEVLWVVRGPLREALARRLDGEQVRLLLERIEALLAPPTEEPDPRVEEATTVELSLDELAESSTRGDATASVPTADAVRVLVFASGSGFARRLELALGERRVHAVHVESPAALSAALEDGPPAVVVLDATDFPTIDGNQVLSALTSLPRTTACVLWGTELPYGKRFLAAAEAHDRPWVTLALREGIGPLLDLIRSRRRMSRPL